MKALVLGTGAVGSRVARQLVTASDVQSLSLIDDDLAVAEEVAASVGPPAVAGTISSLRFETRLERFTEACRDVDVVVLACPGTHSELAEVAMKAGAHVISVSDDLSVVQDLQALDHVARSAERSLVIGAGFSPGLTCLLAKHASKRLDVIDELHVAKFGTGGPACARQHHKALRTDALDWRNQHWEKRRGGSGRELCWFPDPVGGLDCYQAALPDPILSLPAFPGLVRATARVAATRRDRSTKWLPMLRRPHPEGMIGAVRVEARGWVGNARSTVVLGALDRPAVAAGTVAAIAAMLAHEGALVRLGAGGLAELVQDTTSALERLAALGVKAAVFEGGHQDR